MDRWTRPPAPHSLNGHGRKEVAGPRCSGAAVSVNENSLRARGSDGKAWGQTFCTLPDLALIQRTSHMTHGTLQGQPSLLRLMSPKSCTAS